MNRRRCDWRDDEGASLIFALAFIAICGVFMTAALSNGNGATLAGERIADRDKLQYALDGGVSRAINVLKQDAATGNPKYCPLSSPTAQAMTGGASDYDPGGFSLNGNTISYTCQTLSGGGRLPSNFDKNYAIITTSAASDAFEISGSANGSCVPTNPLNTPCLIIDGSIYLSGAENPSLGGGGSSNFTRFGVVKDGSVLESSSVCHYASDPSPGPYPVDNLSSVFKLYGTTPDKKGQIACTPQQLTDTVINGVTIPGALPVVSHQGITKPPTLTAAQQGGVTIANVPYGNCTIFVPGTYTVAPSPNNASFYFMRGYYWMTGSGSGWSNWSIPANSDVSGGAVPTVPPTADPPEGSPLSTSKCNGMNDDVAAAGIAAAAAAGNTTAASLLSASPPLVPNVATSTLTKGVEWVFSGSAQLHVAGGLTLAAPASSTIPTDWDPVNIYEWSANAPYSSSNPAWAADWSPPAGWTSAWNSSGGASVLGVAGGSNPVMQLYGKIYAPDSPVSVFTSGSSVAAASAGVVAYTVKLQSSASSPSGIQLVKFNHFKGPETPLGRLIRIVATDAASASGGSQATNVAVIFINNFTVGYQATVKSWRTDNGSN